MFDQSVFVRAAVDGVLKEGAIAAGLTALMILLFLGSWRSTLIVVTSIPLSILTSIIALWALGYSLNTMTLGGMAMAVGILVDDATVEIENVHRNLGQGKPLRRAILDGAAQVAMPAFVSTLAICIVFVPVLFLTGPAAFLFAPLALAVVFAMLASYFLSRTLVPTMVLYLLPKEAEAEARRGHEGPASRHAFERGFERLRRTYQGLLGWSLDHRVLTAAAMLGFALGSVALYPWIGQDFFPEVDAGQFRLHVRAPAGTRLEETERIFGAVENVIREVVPDTERALILDNIGLTQSFTVMAYVANGTVSDADGEILVALQPTHRPTVGYVARLRDELPRRFPGCGFFFEPADITSQILDFGLPAPIDVQVVGVQREANLAVARRICRELAAIPGGADVHLHQITDVPNLRLKVDRVMAAEAGLTQQDVAGSVLVSLSSTNQVAPNFWINPENRVNYRVAVQTPEFRIDSVDALLSTPIIKGQAVPDPGGRAARTGGPPAQLLGNLADLSRGTEAANINHYNVQPTYDVYANVQGRDLGAVAADVRKVVAQEDLPRGSSIVVRGQVEMMNSSFLGLATGLVFAILLVYFLMVVNFQSWLDPFIVLTALPGALAGILWILFLTQTNLSVPALMGAIMCIGVATANSILMVTFANERRREGLDARSAALSAGSTRLRPVLMTAVAMIVGMLPMSLGLGEGGEQNAPLGRAVIGGLLVATAFTLVFVPVAYAVLRRKPPAPKPTDDELDGWPTDAAVDEAPAHHSTNGRLLAVAGQPMTRRDG
jgi:multidrug efflux pump subunit AcrB